MTQSSMMRLAPLLIAWLLLVSPAAAQQLVGDLDGDGRVGVSDEPWLLAAIGSNKGDLAYEPAADLNADDRVDLLDVDLFGGRIGSSGGPRDMGPPRLRVALNAIHEPPSALLAVPPGGFHITIAIDDPDGSAIDPRSLRIQSSQTLLGVVAGQDLAHLFEVGASGALLRVPRDAEIAQTTHSFAVSVADAAGNSSSQSLEFIVSDFGDRRAPFANRQTIFLDFEQDRSLGPENDFTEDLREFGLSSADAPALEAWMRARLITRIVAQVRAFYGRLADGSPGRDAVDIAFVTQRPSVPHTRLCVGGESHYGQHYLGTTALDLENADEASDDCIFAAFFGVFPSALDDVFAGDPDFDRLFAKLDPDLGGAPFGQRPIDAAILRREFELRAATIRDVMRLAAVHAASEAFVAVLALTIAHETGHLLGLVPHGPTPAGLYGGAGGFESDHNVTADGDTPKQRYVMNAGTSFSFAEASGLGGRARPVFRALNWAYLHDRVVTGAIADVPTEVPDGEMSR